MFSTKDCIKWVGLDETMMNDAIINDAKINEIIIQRLHQNFYIATIS